MYYLKKFCCVCMEGDRMLINTQNLNQNIMYFYYKYVIRDVNNVSVRSLQNERFFFNAFLFRRLPRTFRCSSACVVLRC